MVWSEYTSATHGEEADIDEEVDALAIPYNRELDSTTGRSGSPTICIIYGGMYAII